ncbi:MAG: hypothetical protein CXB60_07480 [Spiroplasma poulsonii]|nr:hypothetical protein [Spiroplasma poulsonii]
MNPQATLSVQFYTNKIIKDITLLKLFGGFNVGINNIIQSTKYKNIDIIIGGEELTKSSAILNNLYSKDKIYKIGKNIFDSFNNRLLALLVKKLQIFVKKILIKKYNFN